MSPATFPRHLGPQQRMLTVDTGSAVIADAHIRDLPQLLLPGDLMVLNDAATLPASLPAHSPDGGPIEVRIAGRVGPGRYDAVVFGAGDWRTPTEHRPPPPPLGLGARVSFAVGSATVCARHGPRWVTLSFGDDGSMHAIAYAVGRPVQYAYMDRDLDLEAVQTGLGGPPWAVEMPSAARPLSATTLGALRDAGVRLATLTHAAGLSATGDAAMDTRLPLPERFRIPAPTARAVGETRRRGRRVIAVGTSVARALEGWARTGTQPRPGDGHTDLIIGPGFAPKLVDGLLSGVHEPRTSHHAVLEAWTTPAVMRAASAHAARGEYRIHEFGDSILVVPDLARPSRVA